MLGRKGGPPGKRSAGRKVQLKVELGWGDEEVLGGVLGMGVLERRKRNDWQRHGMHMGKRNMEDGYSLRSGGGWFQVVMVQVEAVGEGQGWNDWPIRPH